MITQSGGVPGIYFSKPSDTSLTTAYTQAIPGIAYLSWVNIAAVGGADATVIVNDGSTDYEILSAKTLTADDREFIEFRDPLPLLNGYTVKVKTTTGNNLVFTLLVSDTARSG